MLIFEIRILTQFDMIFGNVFGKFPSSFSTTYHYLTRPGKSLSFFDGCDLKRFQNMLVEYLLHRRVVFRIRKEEKHAVKYRL
jgi:hypothetical protein